MSGEVLTELWWVLNNSVCLEETRRLLCKSYVEMEISDAELASLQLKSDNIAIEAKKCLQKSKRRRRKKEPPPEELEGDLGV